MILSNISASGLKGGSFTYPLKPVTILYGEFGSGKTRVLDAIQLALLSYVPRLGKRHGDSFRLASGNTMRVKAAFDSGAVRDLRWERDNGSVKFTGPKDPSVPAVLLDYREFFALTGPERLGMLASKMDVERLGFKPTEIIPHVCKAVDEQCSEIEGGYLAGPTSEIVDTGRMLEASREQEGASVQEWISEFLSKVQERLKAANDAVKQLTGAARTNVQLSGVGGNVPRDTSAEISAAEAELQRVTKVSGDWAALKKRIEAKETQAERLKLRGFTSEATARDSKKKIAEEIRAKISALEKAGAWKDSGIRDRLGDARATFLEVQRQIREANLETDTVKKEHESNLTLSRCPFCKHAGKDWKNEIVKAFKEKSKCLEAKRKKLFDQEPVAKSAFDEMQKESTADYKRYEESQRALAELARLRPILAQVDRDLASIADSQTRRAALLEEIEKLDTELENTKADADLCFIKITELQGSIAIMRSERDRWIKMKGEEQHLARAQTQLRTETDRAAVFKVAAKALQGIQAELIQRSMVALLEPANKLTAGFLPGPFEYQDGDFGYRTPDGKWVGHATMSGTEQAVGYAGLSAALAQEASPKILLMDGLDIDAAGKQSLWIRLVELVKAGVLDQVVATDVSEVCRTVEGVTVIQLERGRNAY